MKTTRYVFSADFADGGQIGLYSTAAKAVAGAQRAIDCQRLHWNANNVTACIKMLKDGHQTCCISALEACDEYDLSKIVVINKRRIQ